MTAAPLSIARAQLAFASPRKLPRAQDLKGRVVVLDLAFASDASGGGFEKITLPFIEELGPRLVGWVDHHDHVMHARYRDDPRFVLTTKAQHGACPEIVTASVIQRIGPADTLVCHTDFDGLCSAAKWLRGGVEPYPGADDDARAIDTRTALPGPIGQRFDRALRARPRDTALFGLVVRHLSEGLADSSLWERVDRAAAELGPIEALTRRIAEGYRVTEMRGSSTGLPPSVRSLAYVEATSHHGKYDKTLLLLLGQERAGVAMVLDLDTLTLAARYGSGVNFLDLLGISGGMPTLVSIPKKRMQETLKKLGGEPSFAFCALHLQETEAEGFRSANLTQTFDSLCFHVDLQLGDVLTALQLCNGLPGRLAGSGIGGLSSRSDPNSGGARLGNWVARMAAKVWGTQQKAVEEVFFQNEAVSLCLLVNRRARTMRVIDFRAGPTAAKRLFVLSLAKREGVDKVYTLVERDEVQTWLKLGFAKEGNIPGFYKRSDAFLLGCSAVAGREPVVDEVPAQSEMRLTVAGAAAPMSAAQARMEATIALAKRGLKDFAGGSLPHAKVLATGEADARKAVVAALKSGRALTAFEPFGRDVERRYFVATSRGGFELHASTESQACFGNAYLELLQSPRSNAERLGTTAALRALCEKLMSEGVVSCFSLAPSDDVALAGAYLHNGFRRTGLLLEHLYVGGRRKDLILWSRKLANPGDE